MVHLIRHIQIIIFHTEANLKIEFHPDHAGWSFRDDEVKTAHLGNVQIGVPCVLIVYNMTGIKLNK